MHCTTPVLTSTPVSRISMSVSNSGSHVCCFNKDLLLSALKSSESKASLGKENQMLKDRLREISDANTKLHETITEKSVQNT